jgi:hypothetical protein
MQGPCVVITANPRYADDASMWVGDVPMGKITEFHAHPNAAGMMMQLGLMPG